MYIATGGIDMTKTLARMIAAMTAVTVLAGIPASALAAEDASAGQTPSGISYEDLGSRIEEWAEDHTDGYPSFAVAVVDGDGLIYSGAFGCTNYEEGIEATPDNSVYEWGSCSKTMIWVSVMQLWEQGLIDLNEDIRNYLPEGFFHNLRYDDPITMLNLMNHEAGWCESTWAFQATTEEGIMELGDVLQYSEPVQMYRPGEMSSYSNYGAAVAGYVVECITGQPYWEYVHENIFEPLGMEHTSIKPAHDDCQWVYERRQTNHSYTYTGCEWSCTGDQLVYIMPYPAGAACGSIEDMALYCQALISDENPLFEREETRDELFSATMAYEYGDETYVAGCHGFWTGYYEYADTLGHNGGTNGGSANLEFDLEDGIGVVTLMNGSGAAHQAMLELVFGTAVTEIPEAASGDWSEADLSGLCISARSWRHGPVRFISMLGIMPITATAEDEYDVAGIYTITRLDEHTYCLSDDESVMLADYRVLDDGTQLLNIGSAAYVTEKGLIGELFLMGAYIVIAAVAAILLIIKLIKKILKKLKPYEGAVFVTAAQIAKLVSFGVIVCWAGVMTPQYGLYKWQGILGCIVHMICFALCGVSAGASIKALAGGQKGKATYIINIIGNILFMSAMIVFELMKFWGV